MLNRGQLLTAAFAATAALPLLAGSQAAPLERSGARLEFVDMEPVSGVVSPTKNLEIAGFLLNNGGQRVTAVFGVTAVGQDNSELDVTIGSGPIFEQEQVTDQAQVFGLELAPRQLRPFTLTVDASTSFSGQLIAAADGQTAVEPALLGLTLAAPQPVLADLRPYWLPLVAAALCVIILMFPPLNNKPLEVMTAFDYDGQKATVSNLTLGVTIVSAIIALGLVPEADKVGFAARAGLFALLTTAAPPIYSLFVYDGGTRSRVGTYLIANFLILLGSFSSLQLATEVLTALEGQYLGSEISRALSQACLVVGVFIFVYAIRRMHVAIKASNTANSASFAPNSSLPTANVRNLL